MQDAEQLSANYLSTQPTTQVNSAFYPSGVGKSGTRLPGWS